MKRTSDQGSGQGPRGGVTGGEKGIPRRGGAGLPEGSLGGMSEALGVKSTAMWWGRGGLSGLRQGVTAQEQESVGWGAVAVEHWLPTAGRS